MRLINTILIAFLFSNLFAQNNNNTIYKNLQVKFHAENISALTRNNEIVYKVNGRTVDKTTYDKYDSWSCCPCIIKSYNENDVLLSESVKCRECSVGEFTEFYPDGKVKIKGQFRENPTGDWYNLIQTGYCSVPTGTWLYYNELNGTYYLHHIEIWDNGQFIEQRPESKKTEIWGVDLFVNTTKIDTQVITMNDFKNIKIVPKYKNANRNTSLLKAKVWIVSHEDEKECSIETLKDINIEEMRIKSKTKNSETINMNIIVFDGVKYIKGFILKIKQ